MEYNFIHQKYHEIVFSFPIINRTLFDIEKFLFKNKYNSSNESHVFITGLPRSGTTAILNLLFSSKEFASLKYSNMPFILSPNISKIFKSGKVKIQQRFHNDGLKIDIESPEEFDEVFFKNFEYQENIKEELINYINLILYSQSKNRYLSKNNLNYKRITLLKSVFQKIYFLITIRNPLDHSNSLLMQHKNFIELQKKNPFILKYMNFLGHNEFGLNHIPWHKPQKYTNPNNLNYWLEQWNFFYSKIYKNFKNDKFCKFIIFENLFNETYILEVLKKINIEKVKKELLKKPIKKEIKEPYDIEMLEKNLILYNMFIS
jgi:hypothetical protein